MSTRETTLPVESRLPGFDGAGGWLNSPPLTPAGLRGRSCWSTSGRTRASTGCERSATSGPGPSATATTGWWWSACTRRSSPSSAIEDNVRRAVAAMDVAYPVALDPDYAVWQAFSNHYWPAIYIADAEGRIRYHHFGEEAYAETERVIQRLLRDAGRDGIGDDVVSIVPGGVEAQADWANLGSPETYLGYQQGGNLVASDVQIGVPGTFAVPDALPLNGWALGRRMDDRGAGGGVEPAGRIYRVPIPRTRRQPGHALPRRDPGAVPGADRRRGARAGPRPRRRRDRPGDAGRAPALPARSGAGRRSPTAPSRSPSQPPASRPTCSRSVRLARNRSRRGRVNERAGWVPAAAGRKGRSGHRRRRCDRPGERPADGPRGSVGGGRRPAAGSGAGDGVPAGGRGPRSPCA